MSRVRGLGFRVEAEGLGLGYGYKAGFGGLVGVGALEVQGLRSSGVENFGLGYSPS